MNGWSANKLGELTTKIGSGATPRGGSSVYQSSGVALIRSQNVLDNAMKNQDIACITDEAARALQGVTVEERDVLINITGDSIARCSVVDPKVLPARVNQHVSIIRTTDELDPRFLQRFLVNPSFKEQLLSMSSGGTRNALTKSDLSNLVIYFPEIEEQRAIAEVLGALDDKIAANSRRIAKVGEVLETTFAFLCGQPDQMVPFSELATITKGVSYRSADLCESSTALVTLKSFDRNGGYSLRGLKEYAGPFKPAQQIAPGELVVAQTDLTQAAEVVGRAVRVPGATGYEKLVASLDLAIVRPRQDSPVEFLLGVMLQGRFRAHCRSRTSGTTVLHLASDAIPSFQAPLVSRDIQENFASVTRPMLHLRDSLEYEMDSLASIRDALLPQLMSGKLRVKDAEKVLEDAGV